MAETRICKTCQGEGGLAPGFPCVDCEGTGYKCEIPETETPPLDLDEVRRTELYLCSDRKGVGCTRKIKLIESLTEEVERLRGRYQTGGRSEIDYCDEIVRLTRELEANRRVEPDGEGGEDGD